MTEPVKKWPSVKALPNPDVVPQNYSYCTGYNQAIEDCKAASQSCSKCEETERLLELATAPSDTLNQALALAEGYKAELAETETELVSFKERCLELEKERDQAEKERGIFATEVNVVRDRLANLPQEYQEAVRLKICKYLEDQGGIGAIEESCDPVDFILASHYSINEDRKDKFQEITELQKNLVETEKQRAMLVAEQGSANKWKKRALAFQEGYRNSQFENTAKEIQLMCLRAEGADKFTAKANEHLRVKLHAMAIERNELKEKLQAIGDADYVLNVDRTWKAKEKEIGDLKDALKAAVSEISEHNSEYQHRTPQEKLDVWLQLVK